MKKHEDEKAFIKMVEGHKRMIYKICYMYADSLYLVNDLFQEVTINLWKGYGMFRGESSLQTWVYRVTLNTCITYIRKKSRDIDTESITMDIDLFEEKEDDKFATLHRMISMLNPIDKAIILLYLEDRSYEEIADLMGMTKSNVGVKLTRIKDKLRQMS